MAAFSRSCGVSAITLRSWQQIDGVPEVGGFEAIANVAVDLSLGFRLTVGNATVECGTLPPAQWVSELLKRLSA